MPGGLRRIIPVANLKGSRETVGARSSRAIPCAAGAHTASAIAEVRTDRNTQGKAGRTDWPTRRGLWAS